MRRTKTAYPGIFFRDGANGRTYEIMYTDSLGKRRSQTVAGGLKDAQRELARIKERMHRGERVAPSRLTVSDLAEEYLRTQTGHLSPKALDTYSTHVDVHIKPRLGHVKVSKLDSLAVAAFVQDLRKAGKSAWTIHGVLTPLSRMMQFAVRKGWAASNPVRGLEKQERPQGFNRPMRVLSTEEIAVLLREVTDHFRPLLMTAIFSGLRIGELLRLEWDDVDFEEGLLRVRKSKTESGIREVSIPDFLVKQLAALSLEKGGDGLVFTTQDGKALDRRAASRGALERTLSRAKVDKCRFHDLRHTYASLLLGQGEDITFVASQMGHSSPAITLRIYAHLFDADSRRQQARERLQEAFSGVAS